MLSIALGETELRRRINGGCAIAAVNASSLCVVAGPTDRIAGLERQLTDEGIACRPVVTSHAFSFPDDGPDTRAIYRVCVSRVRLQEPRLPYVSCVTGTWIKGSEATNPGYWSQHLRKSVQFAAGVRELTQDSNRILLEVGPGNVLSSLAKRNTGYGSQVIVSSLTGGSSRTGDSGFKAGWSRWHSLDSRCPARIGMLSTRENAANG